MNSRGFCSPDGPPPSHRELVLTRTVDAPREKVFAAWTDPFHLRQWLAPAPWTVSVVEADRRAGVASVLLMAGPESIELITVSVTLEALGGRTRYTARVRHWTTTEQEVEWIS